jgi:thiamine pyrophosphate-dependent acetolactate synthase large subunit-like protein
MPKTLIQVDIHSSNLGRHYPTVHGIHAHVRPALSILAELIQAYWISNLGIVYERVKTARRAVIDCADKQHLAILSAVRSALPDDGMLFNDMTTVCYAGPTLFPVDLPRTFFCPNYVGTLGFSFPAALGAKIAEPGKSVVSLSGDGGFMFTSQELSTAVQQQICLPVVVFNDQAYSQLERFFVKSHGRSDPFQLVGPALKTYARSFGIPASRVTSPGGLKSALTKALDRHGPTVIEYTLCLAQ